MYEHLGIGNEESIILLYLEYAHKLVVSTFQDLGDHCLLDMILAACHHRHSDTITIKCKHGVTLCHEDRFVGTIGNKRVLAVGLPDKSTLDDLSLQIQAVLIIRNLL